MAQRKDLRKKAIEYLGKGHRQREAREVFGIGLDTVNRWNQKYQKTGERNDIPPRRRFKKLEPEKLKAYKSIRMPIYLRQQKNLDVQQRQ